MTSIPWSHVQKSSMIFTALASLTMANVKADDSEFISGSPKVITRIYDPATIKRVNQKGILEHWMVMVWLYSIHFT